MGKDIPVASNAGLHRYFFVSLRNSDVLGIKTGAERPGMGYAVLRLRHVLRKRSWRSMTAITAGYGCMGSFRPAIKLLLHDVAVQAGFAAVG